MGYMKVPLSEEYGIRQQAPPKRLADQRQREFKVQCSKPVLNEVKILSWIL
jgi:hypothetical protein